MILEVSKDMPLPSPPSRLPAAALPPPIPGNLMLEVPHLFQKSPATQHVQPGHQPIAASANNPRRKRKPAAPIADGYAMVSSRNER
jgi:hypothetical protein